MIYGKMFLLPKVIELAIPRPFLKAPAVNGADAIVHAINADFIGPESDNVAMFDVGSVDGAIFLIGVSFYEDPEGREWGGGMCAGDFGEGGDEGGIDDVFVYYVGDYTNGGYGGYRKHLGMILFASFQIQYLYSCLVGRNQVECGNGEFVSVGLVLSPTISARRPV